MAIWTEVAVTTIDASDAKAYWAPGQFNAYQLRDYLDFRADFGGMELSVLRLMANQDVHVYGELVLRSPAIRTFDTLVIDCTDGSKDIVSFCSGGAGADKLEKVRISKEGEIAITTAAPAAPARLVSRTVALSAADLSLDGRTITANGEVGSGDTLFQVQNSDVDRFSIDDAGCITITTTSSSGAKITAVDTTPTAVDLAIHGKTIAANGSVAEDNPVFKVTNSSTERLVVRGSGDVFQIHGADVTLSESVNIDALGGHNMAPVGNLNTEAGVIVVHHFDLTDNTAGDTDITVEDKVHVFDVVVIKRSGPGTLGDTIAIKNGANAITNAINLNLPPSVVNRATLNIGSYATISASGTLRATRVQGAGSPDVRCEVYVMCMRVN